MNTVRAASREALSEAGQVALAFDPGRMGPLLAAAFVEPGDRRRGPVCRILDAKYEPGDYCLLLYELDGELVTGTFDWSGEEAEGTGEGPGVRIVDPPGMRVFRFPHDPALPGLAQALDPAALVPALEKALPELAGGAGKILRCRVSVLRFRPGKRCTARLDLAVRERPGGPVARRVLYAKIYHRLDKAEPAFREMQMLAEAPLARGGQIVFARAPAWLPGLAMVLQEPVAGTPMDLYLHAGAGRCHPDTAAGMLRAAAALAALHTAGLSAGRERPIAKELARFHKRAGKIARVNPGLGDELDRLAARLESLLDRLAGWGAEITLVHGDCKPSQFLAGPGGQAALLDFDHCGMADPAGDVGTFLATLQQMLAEYAYKYQRRLNGRPPPAAAWLPGLKQQFLDAYVACAGFPDGFRQRAAWYEAVALLRKAIRSFERSPYSPLPAALAGEAWQVLERFA